MTCSREVSSRSESYGYGVDEAVGGASTMAAENVMEVGCEGGCQLLRSSGVGSIRVLFFLLLLVMD